MRFFVIKKNTIVLIFLSLILSVGAIFASYKIRNAASVVNSLGITVVVDAGHGGRDGGTTGSSADVKESDINLAIAKKLEVYLKKTNINVVMTRKTADGLYSASAKNRKMDDMQARKKIIEKSDADLVVSIHQNAFPQRSVRGATVFYYEHSEPSLAAATKISGEISKLSEIKSCNAKTGEFYMLNCTKVPSVIVECGFLSNAEDEALLTNSSFQEKMAYSIFCGILKHFEIANY